VAASAAVTGAEIAPEILGDVVVASIFGSFRAGAGAPLEIAYLAHSLKFGS
jgi:hypothetical protein